MAARLITRTVWILSLVSLFTDMASEMLYPVIPLYLRDIGFTMVVIGVLEGFAEAIAGLSKGYFGKWSDSIGRRLPFVQLGYTLSALSKPMLALMPHVWWIFTARAIDRLGKGIRTGARDALLSAEATPATKGAVFGFHRSLDTLGATIGPALALLFLYYYPGDYKTLFYVAFIPGIIAIAASFFLKEVRFAPGKKFSTYSFLSFISYWKTSSSTYKRLAGALLVFAVANSSDVFLLLKMKEAGVSDAMLIGIYIFYNAVFSIAAYPIGIIADKIGFKKMLLIGFCVFAVVYSGMAFAASFYHFVILFLLYGLYAAATEGIAKAWISNLVKQNETATAIGTFTAFQSIGALLASTIAGIVWFNFGPAALFLSAGIISVVVIVYISFNIKSTRYA